jgi:hypothetical protein
MRLLGVTSEEEGRDWDRLVKRIDQLAQAENFDLAEETVVIEVNDGSARVFRPVIGGLRELQKPWLLEDRTAEKVELVKLSEDNWDDLQDEIEEVRPKNAGGYTLLLKRRLAGELRLSAEVFFRFF